MRYGRFQRSPHSGKGPTLILPAFLLALYVIVLVRTAWVCDDAFITLRTVDNFVNGHGLTWNIAERVQAYTHPLWMFVLSAAYALTHEPFTTTLLVSIIVSTCAVAVLAFWVARQSLTAALGVIALLCSKAFLDYSTSGLENPLAYLLVAIFAVMWFRGARTQRELAFLSFVASLVVLTRMDLALLVLPAVGYAAWRRRSRRAALAAAAGFLPFVAWELFSLWYYGFLFPNTAYAKLNTGIGWRELMSKGLPYFLDSLRSDHVTLPLIAAAVGVTIARRDREALPPAAGIVLYLAYVARIGGDFMSGRALAVPFLCAVIVLAHRPVNDLRIAGVVAAALVALGLTSPHPSVLSGESYGLERGGGQKEVRTGYGTFAYWPAGVSPFMATPGISDERAYYYQNAGLLRRLSGVQVPNHVWVYCGLVWRGAPEPGVFPSTGVGAGYAGYYAGPRVHIIDEMALGDPLLARLPPLSQPNWRIGHFTRAMPEGYVQTLEQGHNVMADSGLARYYDKLSLITRGSLLSAARLKAIWEMNTGAYRGLIDQRPDRVTDPARPHRHGRERPPNR